MEIKYNLNEVELARLEAFKKKHRCSCSLTDEDLNYIISPTGIGVCVSVSCDICKEVENITDYDKW